MPRKYSRNNVSAIVRFRQHCFLVRGASELRCSPQKKLTKNSRCSWAVIILNFQFQYRKDHEVVHFYTCYKILCTVWSISIFPPSHDEAGGSYTDLKSIESVITTMYFIYLFYVYDQRNHPIYSYLVKIQKTSAVLTDPRSSLCNDPETSKHLTLSLHSEASN